VVQPLITSAWYAIPGYLDKRIACSVLGCVMPATITDGKRAICVQHATEHAMSHTISLRVVHDEDSHHPDGHCINCGECLWNHDRLMRVYQCLPCTGAGIMTANNIVDLKSFSSVPDGGMLSKLSHIQAAPKDEKEQARTRAWVEDYLAWREGKPAKK